MKLSGIELANHIRPVIKAEAETLISNGIQPHFAIITLGEEESWQTYVKQKLKWAQRLSVKATLINLQNSTTDKVLESIDSLNNDPTVHGIIVQRPLPPSIDKQAIVSRISPEKDVDGFRSDSPYEVPVWMAVKHMLTSISQDYEDSLSAYLRGKKVSVIGKGETAGRPIISGLTELDIQVSVINRSTDNPNAAIKESDIVISCVGKNVINKDDMHAGQILIGVGIRTESGKLKGDFDEIDAEQSGTLYTPTPGGVGPLNLTFLLQNVLQAAQFARDKGEAAREK